MSSRSHLQIRPATSADVPAIEAIVERAYSVYVERIGGRPGPMDHDYADRVRRGLVSVADDGRVAGLIVLMVAADHLLIENVAVDPERQREGIGGTLLAYAEDQARRHALGELRLYTNAAMTENLARYARLGYVEDGRRTEHGFTRVFMSKRLS
jgi:N-acetylglutamate synthase-like GNAT family acetyltransferase